MQAQSRITTFQSILDSLGFAIVSGQFGPSGSLPTEAEMAKNYSVSRNAVREAIKALIAKGMLGTRTRTGLFVLQPEHWNTLDVDLLRWRYQHIGKQKFLHEIYDLRMMMEPYIHAAAALRITDEEIVELKAIFERMKIAAGDMNYDSYMQADDDFHALIYKASHNPLVFEPRNMINAAVAIAWRAQADTLSWYIEEHETLMNAIIQHDAKKALEASRDLLVICMTDVGIHTDMNF